MTRSNCSAGYWTPPGQESNPSAWRRRIPIAVLALVGCATSTYLALYQYGVLTDVWDPIFGSGSEAVLTSTLSTALPVPDGAIGAAAYLVEAVLELAGGRRRWADRSLLVLTLGLVAAGLGVAGLVLVIAQPLLTGTFCSLCLASAVISIAVLVLVRSEISAAWTHVRQHGNNRPI
ncbi:vitamin K epoxide reductase [Kibdelosporangium aridum]|uniref:Vitamin K epoxide reductase n=1 Tax=Kibdelosporangium aridum TaxID=2030 RepID=A0A428ZB30_KIBAR|nr:vitamin K epoxide reductase family protein [Kibdelosporangium aridum]RSM85269.1 vitamin K epoxide reductase [Kibdelosporangium aridum]